MHEKKLIPKHELRKIKMRVAKLRAQGHEIWTDDEVEAAGWILQDAGCPSSGGGVYVQKEKQKDSWDCGLACVQMVLGTLGDIDASQSVLASRVSGKSVWTIDLAYLLCEYGVAAQYLTSALTVNAADYEGSTFYAGTIDTDAVRVNRLLAAAATEGVEVVRRSLSAVELWNLMSEEETMIVALVDHNLLYARVSPSQPASQTPSRTPSRPASRPPSRASSYANDLASLAEGGIDCGGGGGGGVSVAASPRGAPPASPVLSRRAATGAGKAKGGIGKASSRSASCVDLSSLAEEATGADADAGTNCSSHHRGRQGSRAKLGGRRAASHADLASLAAGPQEERLNGEVSVSFAGHYILILGVDDSRGGFIINDPAHDSERTCIPADALEAARHATGTDEDLLLIQVYQPSPPTSPIPSSAGDSRGDSKIERCLRRLAQEEAANDDGVGEYELR